MGWGSIYRRRLKVFALALLIYLDYKMVQRKAKWSRKTKRSEMWERTHQRNAKRILDLIIELEGLWVKLGQYLSTRADVLPRAYIVVLTQLQDSLPPRPLREVKRTIEKELGRSMDDIFSNFIEKPLATASIAQVHRATLKDGKEVVVKVQHSGIKEVILDDLKNAKAIINWIAWAEPQHNFNPLIDEWCKEVPRELDFNHEAENTKLVSRNLGCRSSHVDDPRTKAHEMDVDVPEIIQSTEMVLILEFMDGIRLNDYASLVEHGVDRQKVVEEITRAYSHQIYVDGFFNADPHPGNFLVSKTTPHRPILLDFGLTKSLTNPLKQALAKMFLSAVEGDHVALLSAFAEMGLKLRLDMPEQAMDVIGVVFRAATTADEAPANVRFLTQQRAKNMKLIQEKMKMSDKEIARFNPIDAFPEDAVLFVRVLHLLRGLSSSLNVAIDYKDIMRPFAESTLRSLNPQSMVKTLGIYDTKALSNVEVKLRQHLLELGTDKILGIQVCAYKDGKIVVDTAAGMLGKYDPRAVQPDSLFPVFSATKGITAGMLHWLVDKGKLNYEERVANIWPDFEASNKGDIKVHHVLNHTSGLQSALGDVMATDPLLLSDWDEMLRSIAMAAPTTEPGSKQSYHYLSFGWLCGGLIEHASGKKFQKVLEEAIVYPLNIEGELYIGIPPGVEMRLAALTLDTDDVSQLGNLSSQTELPDNLKQANLAEMASALPMLFNTLNMRRAIVPAANGHCSARALARYYAALAAGGPIPSTHTTEFQPPLGSHPHIPQFPSLLPSKKKKKGSNKNRETAAAANMVPNGLGGNSANNSNHNKHVENGHATPDELFQNPKIHDAFTGVGDYANLVMPDGKFGLGFRRFDVVGRRLASFGHSGIGGSTGFCDVENNFAIAVTINKMSLGGVTRSVVRLVCSELGVPVPLEFADGGERGPDMVMNLG